MAEGRVPCEDISASEAKPVLREQWAGGRDPGHHAPMAHQAGDALLVQTGSPVSTKPVPKLTAAGRPRALHVSRGHGGIQLPAL